jgi:hypothetical protein
MPSLTLQPHGSLQELEDSPLNSIFPPLLFDGIISSAKNTLEVLNILLQL